MNKQGSKLDVTKLQIIINFILAIVFSFQAYEFWAEGKNVLSLFFLVCFILVSIFSFIGVFLLLKNKNNNENHKI